MTSFMFRAFPGFCECKKIGGCALPRPPKGTSLQGRLAVPHGSSIGHHQSSSPARRSGSLQGDVKLREDLWKT